MFTFKDSNFYVNQVCVPYCRAAVGLEDGDVVDINLNARVLQGSSLDARKLTKSANGEYIVLGEHLNREVVIQTEHGYAIEDGHYPAGTHVRAYRLKNLVGVEFVTDRIASATVGKSYRYDGEKFVEGGSASVWFKVISVDNGIATVVITDEQPAG